MYMGQKTIRITFSKEARKLVEKRAKSLGLKETQYLRNLAMEDIRKYAGDLIGKE